MRLDARGGSDGPSRLSAGDAVVPKALYVHVPLCASKCSYCDFFSLPIPRIDDALEGKLVESTLARASSLADRFGSDGFDTVYVGGGTPTVLSRAAFERLLSGLRSIVFDSGGRGPVEWTVEANPDSLGRDKLEAMAGIGVSRLSLGVQSLEPDELELLGRRHGPEEALQALRKAGDYGLSLSADLMAAIPSRKLASMRPRSPGALALAARELVDAGAGHLSVYDLCVEEGTPIAGMRDDLAFPGEEESAEERRGLESALRELGMRRYEVSNYASPGRECLHNLAYWRMDSYIGAGPGAVSTIALKDGSSLRIEEPRSIEGYCAEGRVAASESPIGRKDAAFETMMMAFRTSFGLDLDSFRKRFGLGADSIIGSTLEAWKPWIVQGEPWPDPRVRGKDIEDEASSAGPALTGEGLDILNRFLVDCLAEVDRAFPP